MLNTVTDRRTEQLLAIAQAIQAAGVLPTESGRRMVGFAKAARLSVKADEHGFALAALTELDAIADELATDTDNSSAGRALARRVELAVRGLGA